MDEITDAVGDGDADLGGLRSSSGVRSVAMRDVVCRAAGGFAPLERTVGRALEGQGHNGDDGTDAALRE